LAFADLLHMKRKKTNNRKGEGESIRLLPKGNTTRLRLPGKKIIRWKEKSLLWPKKRKRDGVVRSRESAPSASGGRTEEGEGASDAWRFPGNSYLERRSHRLLRGTSRKKKGGARGEKKCGKGEMKRKKGKNQRRPFWLGLREKEKDQPFDAYDTEEEAKKKERYRFTVVGKNRPLNYQGVLALGVEKRGVEKRLLV